MKKYFVKGIEDEPLEYGDVVGVDLVKESDDKTKTIKRHVEVPFTPNTEDMLLDLEIIEEKEVEEDKEAEEDKESSVEDIVEGNTDSDGCPVEEAIDNIDEAISQITDILSEHQAIIKKLMHKVETLEKKKEPIDIFYHPSYKSNPFEPVIKAFYTSLQ